MSVPEYLRGLDDEQAAPGPARSVRLSDVVERPVAWLADGMIPWGALTQLVGRGGQGKTTFAGHVAARLTRGQPIFPGMSVQDPADVLIVSAEDAIESVLAPRLRIAGADMARVHVWNLTDHDLVLPDAVTELEREIRQVDARLVVIDPLSAFLSARTDSHRDASLRGVLRPLHALAERSGLGILGILHVNQSQGGDVAVRTSGSGAWIHAARSALAFGRPPDADESDPRRIVALAKSNYAPLGVAYEVTLQVPPGEEHPRIAFSGVSSVRAIDVLGEPGDEEARTGAADCAEWLGTCLADGPRPKSDISRDAAAAGFTPKNLRSARERLKVTSQRSGFGPGSAVWWTLPDIGGTAAPPYAPSPEGTCDADAPGACMEKPHRNGDDGHLEPREEPIRAPVNAQGTYGPESPRTSPSAQTKTCGNCGDPWPGLGKYCDACEEGKR